MNDLPPLSRSRPHRHQIPLHLYDVYNYCKVCLVDLADRCPTFSSSYLPRFCYYYVPKFSSRLWIMTSTITRCFQFLAWLAVSFAFVVVVLINVGGVDPYSTQPGQNPILRNQGFELASVSNKFSSWCTTRHCWRAWLVGSRTCIADLKQWYLNGEDKISISNYFHYRLYLNSVCAINPSLQRGSGNCFQHGVLGSFLLSHNEPNAYVRIENPYDPILGRLNFTTAFAFYFLTAATLALLIFILPFGFLAGPSSSKVPRLRQYICLVSASVCLHNFNMLLRISNFYRYPHSSYSSPRALCTPKSCILHTDFNPSPKSPISGEAIHH